MNEEINKDNMWGMATAIDLHNCNPKTIRNREKIKKFVKKENIYFYKLAYRGRYIDQLDQFTYLWNDKKFAINWPIKKPILSTRDQKL